MSENTLVQTTNTIHQIMAEIEMNDGLITEEQEKALANNVDKLVFVMERLELLQGFYASKAAHLNTISKRFIASLERLEDNVKQLMLSQSLTKLEGESGDLALQKTKASVKVIDAGAIPAELMREKISYEPNKVAIAAMFEKGEQVPGCQYVQGHSLRIKTKGV